MQLNQHTSAVHVHTPHAWKFPAKFKCRARHLTLSTSPVSRPNTGLFCADCTLLRTRDFAHWCVYVIYMSYIVCPVPVSDPDRPRHSSNRSKQHGVSCIELMFQIPVNISNPREQHIFPATPPRFQNLNLHVPLSGVVFPRVCPGLSAFGSIKHFRNHYFFLQHCS